VSELCKLPESPLEVVRRFWAMFLVQRELGKLVDSFPMLLPFAAHLPMTNFLVKA
jgi:hypothetical protein